MSNLIDRDAFEVVSGVVPEEYDAESYLAGNKEILEMIDAQPTIDAVPIVRCGECIHHRKPLYPHPTMIWCPMIEHHRRPDWFCKDGRREKE